MAAHHFEEISLRTYLGCDAFELSDVALYCLPFQCFKMFFVKHYVYFVPPASYS